MWYSGPVHVMTGLGSVAGVSGGRSARGSSKIKSESDLYGCMSEAWKTLHLFAGPGMSRVTVLCESSKAVTVYGPLKRGCNRAVSLSPSVEKVFRRCFVESRTRSPICNGGFGARCLFAWPAWLTLDSSRLSDAAAMSLFKRSMNSAGVSTSRAGSLIRGGDETWRETHFELESRETC